MIDPELPAGTAFEQLLSVMPRIAEVVNQFTSEENQRVALGVLLRARGLSDEPPAREAAAEPGLSVVPPLADGDTTEHDKGETVPDASVKASATGRRRPRKAAAKKSWSRAKDINFRPEGKQSWRDFVAEKVPVTNFERNLAAVYYLQEILGLDAIDVSHVLAAFAECEWRSPTDPENSLTVTASRKGWLDTSDLKAITVTYRGRNTVQFDLPKVSVKKSA